MEQNRRPRRSPLRRNRAQQGAWLSMMLMSFVLFFGIINLLVPDRSHSDSENRTLAQRPKFSLSSLADGSYFEGVDDYLADQFVGRDFLISLRMKFIRLMGASESNGVLLCDDDYLMAKPVAPNAEAVARNVEAINAFAARHRNLNLCVSIVPTAAGVMEEKLPSNVPLRDQQADIQALGSSLSGVKFIDVTEALRAQARKNLYYRTDHHWTSLGAYFAFCDMADELVINPVAGYETHTVSTTFEGTLASKSGCHDASDKIEVYTPNGEPSYCVTYASDGRQSASLYQRSALNQKDHYTVFFGGNHPRIDIQTDANTQRRILIFKDSYANCFVQFLTPYYDQIIIIDPRFYDESAEDIIASESITDVLFLYNIDTFHEDTTLHRVLK